MRYAMLLLLTLAPLSHAVEPFRFGSPPRPTTCICGPGCECEKCPGDCFSYAAQRARAVKSSKPLLVFVNCGVRRYGDYLTHAATAVDAAPMIAVFRPDAAGNLCWTQTLSPLASVGEIQASLGRRTR